MEWKRYRGVHSHPEPAPAVGAAEPRRDPPRCPARARVGASTQGGKKKKSCLSGGNPRAKRSQNASEKLPLMRTRRAQRVGEQGMDDGCALTDGD